MRGIVLAIGLSVFGAPCVAQTWTANSFDTGALIHGGAIAPDGTFALSCTAPSPQGRPLIETGDHETLRTDTPYGLAVSFSVDLIDPVVVDPDLPAAQMILDGRAYALPAMQYSDFYGAWTGLTSIETPGILELFQATELILVPGHGPSIPFTVAGLSAAMDMGLGPCVERWFDLGNPLPPRLQAYIATGVAPDQPTPTPVPLAQAPALDLPAGLSPAQQFEIPDVAPQTAFDHVASQCLGAFDVAPDAIQAADLDGDGVADYILNYSGLTCGDGTRGTGRCGAANCSIEIFVSTRSYADPFHILGTDLLPVVDAQGRTGMLLYGTQSVCAGGMCDTPFVWTGSGFAQ